MIRIWIERCNSRGSKGIAEIYVEGGAMKYERKTCIGRLFQKHLTGEQAKAFVERIEKAIKKFDFSIQKIQKMQKKSEQIEQNETDNSANAEISGNKELNNGKL